MGIEDYLNPEHSIRKEIALLFSLIGTAVSLVSFVATDWAKPDNHPDTNPVMEIGLWRICRYVDPAERNREACFTNRAIDLPGWFRATQALCAIGFCLQLITLVLVISSECFRACRQNIPLVFTFVGTGLSSVLIITPALILFADEIKHIPLSYTMSTVSPIDSTIMPVIHTYRIAWAYYLIAAGTAVQPFCAFLGIWDAVVHHKASAGHTPMVEEDSVVHLPYGSISKSQETA